jgi:TolA-binding protein
LANGKSAAEAAFREGWAELRNGRQLEALAAFERAMALQPQSPFAEDAAFWRAVTLERSGQRAGAELALDDFVTRHRASARVGEASAMLGWMLLERGHLEQARTRFLAARDDRAQRIAASARAGLAELSRHKH